MPRVSLKLRQNRCYCLSYNYNRDRSHSNFLISHCFKYFKMITYNRDIPSVSSSCFYNTNCVRARLSTAPCASHYTALWATHSVPPSTVVWPSNRALLGHLHCRGIEQYVDGGPALGFCLMCLALWTLSPPVSTFKIQSFQLFISISMVLCLETCWTYLVWATPRTPKNTCFHQEHSRAKYYY